MNENSMSISPTGQAEAAASRDISREDHWRHFDNSVNAVSFGFVATAILISMFLVMAIFERFLRPRPSFSSPHDSGNSTSLHSMDARLRMRYLDKLEDSTNTSVSTYERGVSVVMPGQDIPTFIAHPVPVPCPPEGISWPLHEEGHYFGSSSLGVRSFPMDQDKTGENAAEPQLV